MRADIFSIFRHIITLKPHFRREIVQECLTECFPEFSFSLLLDAPSVSIHLANEEPIPSRLIIRPENENVTLKCRADANPPVDSNNFGWYKNVNIPFSRFLLRSIFRLFLWLCHRKP